MAIPIKETPILYGEDAWRLQQAMQNVMPESNEKQTKMIEYYKLFKRMFNNGKREEDSNAQPS